MMIKLLLFLGIILSIVKANGLYFPSLTVSQHEPACIAPVGIVLRYDVVRDKFVYATLVDLSLIHI